MSNPENVVEQVSVDDTTGQTLSRSARALVGWMEVENAILVQAGRRMDHPDREAFAAVAAAARQAVAAREPLGLQEDVLHPPPSELAAYIEVLSNDPGVQPMFAEGWRVMVADLPRVCSIQPTVFTDHAADRVRNVDPADIGSIAQVSLPLPEGAQLPAQFDPIRNAWLLVSANPNLRVLGHFAGEVAPGAVGFGFAVQLSPSFMQVANLRGRLFLRDGYHRAFGLLERGITQVPVFTRTYQAFEEVGLNPGMLPQDAYLGNRPALLADYLDPEVAVDVQLPTAQKMIVVQALELSPLA